MNHLYLSITDMVKPNYDTHTLKNIKFNLQSYLFMKNIQALSIIDLRFSDDPV